MVSDSTKISREPEYSTDFKKMRWMKALRAMGLWAFVSIIVYSVAFFYFEAYIIWAVGYLFSVSFIIYMFHHRQFFFLAQERGEIYTTFK